MRTVLNDASFQEDTYATCYSTFLLLILDKTKTKVVNKPTGPNLAS